MEVFRLSRWLYVALLFILAACQPVTRQPEMPFLIEYKIPTHAAHAGGITVGADGALWFAETGANQIGRISVDGIVTEYPVPTEDAIDPTQGFVGLGPDGAIWFNEDRVNKLGRITLDGTITEVDLPQGVAPIRQIVAGTDGALWVTAIDANKIVKLSTEGKVLAEYTLPKADSVPVGMVVGPDGAFWFVENGANQIGHITLEGVITEYAIPTANSVPLRLTVGPDNALWFTMARANKIGRISVEGKVTEYDVPGMLPVGIAAGADGALWFTGYQSTEIGRLTIDGVLTKLSIPTYAAVPYHIVAGPDGNLWFTEQQGNQIGQIKLPATTAEQEPVGALTTFSPKTFRLPLTLAYGPEWRTPEDYSDQLYLKLKDTAGAWELAFNLVTRAKIADPHSAATIPWPKDFVAYLRSNPYIEAGEPKPVTVGGIEGIQIDAYAKYTGERRVLFDIEESSDWLYLDYEEMWRFILLDDVNGERLLITMIVDPNVEELSAFTKVAQKVLDTVVFSKPLTTFSSKTFKLPMSVSFGTEWLVADEKPGVVQLRGHDVDLAFMTTKDAKIASAEASAEASFSMVPFPDDFVTWIQSHGLFQVVETQPVVVGGFQGIQINTIVTAACINDRQWIFPLGTDWRCGMSGDPIRFIYLDDVYGERVLIFTEGLRSEEDFMLGGEAAQKVLDTVVFSKPTTFSPKLVKTPMSVSFGADWQVVYDLPAKFEIRTQHDFGLAFYIVTNAQLADPMDGDLIPFPEDFLAWIKSNPDFAAVKSTPVTVAGMAGVQIDATPIWKSTTTHLKLFLSLSGDKLGNMHGQPDGENIVNDPEQWRFILLDDVHGERVLIILIVGNGHKFEDAVEQSQKVLDTVVFVKP